MKITAKHRVLSLFLAVLMVVGTIPASMITVFSTDGESLTTENHGKYIGAVIKFKETSNILMAQDPEDQIENIISGLNPSTDEELKALRMTVVNYWLDEVNNTLWLKVKQAPGFNWPEKLGDHHYIKEEFVDIVSENGMTGVFDADGNAVTEMTMGVYDQPVLTAESSLQGAVKYQWQIEYEDGKWVDIYGEDEASTTVTIGMLASLLNTDGIANLRCVSTSASKTSISDSIAITVDFNDIGEDGGSTSEPTLNIVMNNLPVTVITMKYQDYDYTAPLTVSASNLTGNVTYIWKLIKLDGTEVVLAENAGASYTLDYSTINSNSQYFDETMFKVTLSVTATNGTDSVTKTVEIQNLSNSVTDYIQNEDGEYIDVYVAGNIPSDVTLDLTQTESSVDLPSDSSIAATLDITLRDSTGAEWQPAEGETVKISINAARLGLEPGDFFTVYHMHEGKVQLLGPYVVDSNGYATFEVVGFSLFALSTSFEAVIGSTATFLDATVVLNSAYDSFDGTIAYTSDLPEKVVVLAYAFDDVTCKTYVKIEAAPGYAWPETYAGLYWVESTELATVSINGETGIYDADGNLITETTMGTYDEPTYTASSTLQGELTYQWQICYDVENDLWVDIYGQNAADVKLTVGMLASRLDANGVAYVRCVVSDAMRSSVSSELAVTVSFESEDDDEEDPEDTYTADITIDDQVLDSVEVYYGDYGFEAVLGVTTNLTGNLTYSWDLYYNGALSTNLSTESTLEIYYMLFNGNWEYVDDDTRKATIVLTVSDGTNTCESTFVVYENSAAPVSLETYSLMSARSVSNDSIALAAEVEKYTVTIQYVFEDGKQAATYYTTEVSNGVNATNLIAFPTVKGYLPYYDGQQVNELQLNVIGSETNADVVYTVTYKPAPVDVTVVIKHQNIYDDGYTQVATETIQRVTGTTIETIDDFSYPGFYQLEHSKPEVAADGSTVVEIRFNRLYFLMRFYLDDGGYGVQPVYARYGTEVVVPKPERPGYIFLNWKSYDGSTVNADSDGNATFTMPAYDCTVTAVWEATDVNYTIVYWKENADPNADGTYGYSYWTSRVVASRAGEYVSGSNDVANYVDDEQYFTYNDARTDKEVLVKGDSSTVVNVYYTRNSYTIYFYGNGDCAIPEHTHGDGTCNGYLICGKETHEHDETCGDVVLSCSLEVHEEHTEACCTKEVHEQHTSECCTAVHEHSASCYTVTYQRWNDRNQEYQTVTLTLTAIQDDPTDNNNNAEEWDNGIVRTGWDRNYSYYIQLDGIWYQLSGTGGGPGGGLNLNEDTELSGAVSCTKVHSHSDGDCTCELEIHTHGDGNCSCAAPIHTHSDACYTYTDCTDDAHTHADACYSDCTLVEHTHGNCPTKYQGEYNVIRVITAKYDADIYDEWPTADDFDGLAYWTGNGNTQQSSRVVTMNKDWCKTDGILELYANYDSTKYQLNYWFEDFDQESTTTSDTRVYNADEGKYYVLSERYSQVAYYGDNQDSWGYKEITGMKATAETAYNSNDTFNLYYDRLTYTLKFQNIDEVIRTETNVMFEKPLSYYLDADGNYISTIIPTYPDSLEDGAYEFAGWYTTPECFEGTEFDFATGTMPNGDLTLFAKWAPVKHIVSFYKYKDSASGTLMEKIGDSYEVPHGSKINEQYIPEAPEDFENGQYSFDGWFYMDGGVEKAFSFEDMTVTRDLEVYAKWISNKQINYAFHFKLADGTVIADSITGSGLAGETITISAKGDTELYEDYREGYFPDAKSHSIDLDIEDADGYQEHTFIYTPATYVPYTVYYVAETLKEGGTALDTIVRDGKTYYIIAETKEVKDNRKATVVEAFKPVSGYMPDAYQKSLVVMPNATNEIIFYYSVDNEHAYYKVTHYIQGVDGTGWLEYRVIQLQGTIGTEYSADPITISGFTHDSTVQGTVTSGTLTAAGLELKLYYTRNQYPYKVIYKVQGTDTILWDSSEDENGPETDYFDKVVSHSAPTTYGNYDLVGESTQTCVIQVEQDLNDPKLNVITYYYVEREVEIKYVVVGPDGCGTVDPTSESVKISTGTATGSTATPKTGYKFVGWYSHWDCTEDQLLSTDLHYTPTKANTALWVDGTTYYAKFEELEVTINYVAVGPANATDFGTVTPTTETVGVISGNPSSTAAASSNVYKFVGWYDNAGCTGDALSTDATYNPKKVDGLHVAATYYAKFEYNLTSLTIVKSGAEAYKDIDPNQTFIFNIKGNGVDLDVTVHRDENSKWSTTIDGLTVGATYTITEKTDWSWRYNCTGWTHGTESGSGNVATITLGVDGTITFTNTRSNEQWLDGDSWCDNIFTTAIN